MQARLSELTVMFADITGSTRLYAVLGDEAGYAITASCLALMEECVGREEGATLKRTGDGVLAVFPSPRHALAAAVAMRRAVSDEDGPRAQHGVTIHTGISHGEGVRVEGDVYGDVVNIAARLLGRAELDEILISGAVYERLDTESRRSVRLIGELALRNRPGHVLVYAYCGDQDDTATTVNRSPMSPAAGLEVSFGSKMLVVGPERPALSIGRALENDLVVDDPTVSRRHAAVELRAEKFYVRDLSTNGTRLELASGDEVLLCREEVMIIGSGRIYLSRHTPAIDFRVVSTKLALS